MPQKVRETKHTVQDNGLQTISRIMQVIFAFIQIMLVFRFAFKLLGANASNVFVNLIYATTAPLVGLFEGIFSEVNMEGSTFAVFEPATVIAIIVTAAVSYIVLRMLSVKQDKKIEHVEVQEQTNPIPLGQVSEAQLEQASAPPVAQTSETPVAQKGNNKLENESQELEERIRQQEQILEHQRKTYGAAHDENKSRELEERIRHQQQILEDQKHQNDILKDQQEVYDDTHDESQELRGKIRHQQAVYGDAHDEKEPQELEEKIRHQEQVLEDQLEMNDTAHNENELDEEPKNIRHEDQDFERRRRQI